MDTAEIYRKFKQIIDTSHSYLVQKSSLKNGKLDDFDDFLTTLDNNIMLIIQKIFLNNTISNYPELLEHVEQNIRNAYSSKDKQKLVLEYFKIRYDTLLRKENLNIQTRGNRISSVLGTINPATVSQALKPSYENKKYVYPIHELARKAGVTNFLHRPRRELYDKYIDKSLLRLTYNSIPEETNYKTDAVKPNMVMCPTLVALFTLRTYLYKRFVFSDLARVVSNQLKNEPLRTVGDAQLFMDVTTLDNGVCCDVNPYKDLLERCKVHTALKMEISMLKSGELIHSSELFYNIINRAFNLRKQVNYFMNPHDIVRCLCQSLSYNQTVMQRMPQHMTPGAPIEVNSGTRIPYITTFLPPRGNDIYEKLKNDDGKYPLIPKPEGIGWMLDKNGRVYKNFTFIRQTKNTLIVLVKRIQKELLLPFYKELPPEKDAHNLVNDTAVSVSEVIGPRQGTGYLCNDYMDIDPKCSKNMYLRSVVCADYDDERVLKGYYSYVKHGEQWKVYHPVKILLHSKNNKIFKDIDKQTSQKDWETKGMVFLYTVEPLLDKLIQNESLNLNSP